MDRISAHCLEAADESVTEVGAAAVADAVGPHFLGRHACRASRLPLIQTEYRPSAPLHHRGHLLKTPRGTSKGRPDRNMLYAGGAIKLTNPLASG